jgi:acetyl-CoA carboxylase biotin carboxylase subunit
MRRALGEFEVTGVRTTIGFLAQVVDHPAFRSTTHDTGLVDQITG